MKTRHYFRGEIAIGLIIFLAVVAIFILIVFVAYVATSSSPSPTSTGNGQDGQVPGTNTCFSQCIGVVELECGTGTIMGACLGAWGCSAELGTHTCLR